MPLYRWFRSLPLGLRSLFRREVDDRELDDELHYHLDLKIEENIAKGMTPQQARRDAKVELGGVEQVKEQVRGARTGAWLGTLLQDIRFGLRMLRKNPGFTAVAVLTLALGIGANTAIFSVVDAVLLRPLPFSNPSRLVMVWEAFPKLNHPKLSFSPPDFVSLERAQQSFEGIGGYREEFVDISGQGQPEQVTAARVSASLFPVLGVGPAVGHVFAAEDDTPGNRVVLLSYGLWRSRYAGDSHIVGRTIDIDRQPYMVVGVMPKTFAFPLPGPDGITTPAVLWIPMAFEPSELHDWGRLYATSVIARLKPDVTLEQARSEVASLAAPIFANYSAGAAGRFHNVRLELSVNPLRDEISGPVRTLLLVLMAAVSMLLLIICANVATLLISRGASRQKEIAIRTALGATQSRLLRQMLTESLLLALAGGALGFALAVWGKDLLLSLVPEDVLLPHQVSIDGRVTAFIVAVSCLTAIFFGLAPAYQASKVSLEGHLRESSRGGTPGRASHRLQDLLVILEFALALVLVVASGLLIRSFTKLLATDPGFRPDHVLTLSLPLPVEAYPKAVQIREFYQQVFDRVSVLPGVKDAGLASDLPIELGNLVRIDDEDPNQASRPSPGVPETWAMGDYFQVTGIALIEGRWFTPEDRLGTQPVAIVSQSMARYFWPGQDAIGKQIRWGQPDSPWQTVVGVVGDVNDPAYGQPGKSHVYSPYLQLSDQWVQENVYGTWRALHLIVRTQSDPGALTSAVVAQIHSLDPDFAVASIRTMTQVMDSTVAGPKFNTFLLGVLGGMALLLASIGIYGVLAHVVARQTHEFGIRMALGAERRDVLVLVLSKGLRLAAWGTLGGVACALVLTRLMSDMLYGVSSTDPATFIGVVIVLLTVALLACYIPARRATRVDPMVALRHE